MSDSTVKQQLQSALTSAMKARDEVALSALRQALSAISVAETAGAVQAELSLDQTLAVLAVEVRKHHESADAFVTAGRSERVERERAEAAVLEAYLPAALSDDDLDAGGAVDDASATDQHVTARCFGGNRRLQSQVAKVWRLLVNRRGGFASATGSERTHPCHLFHERR